MVRVAFTLDKKGFKMMYMLLYFLVTEFVAVYIVASIGSRYLMASIPLSLLFAYIVVYGIIKLHMYEYINIFLNLVGFHLLYLFIKNFNTLKNLNILNNLQISTWKYMWKYVVSAILYFVAVSMFSSQICTSDVAKNTKDCSFVFYPK